MQERKKEVEDGAAPTSQPFPSVSHAQTLAKDDNPDEIFLNAVAEIDTQPLPKRTSITVSDIFQTVFLLSLMCIACAGMVWQAITYPHTLVLLFARTKSATITVALAIPTRTLAPVTVSRSQTAPTTGKGHQDARAATGSLTFYNGNFSPQSITVGTVFTGSDGVKIATNVAVTIPAAQPPQFALASVAAYAVSTGSNTNIATGDIHLALSSDLLVKNLAAFAGGRESRDFQAVAQHDLDTLTSTGRNALAQQIPQAFPLRPGETVHLTTCTTKTTADHGIGEEATTVTVTARATCMGVAYSQDELTRQATLAFTHTRPAAHYYVMRSVQITIQSVSPFSVTIHGTWAYTFSTGDEQYLAEHIAGDTPEKAKAYLLSTGAIASASVPSTLPLALYINFVVLVG